MPKTGHRIRKHEMKEDSFVTFAFRAQEMVLKRQRPIMIGFGLLVVLIAGLWFLSLSDRSAESAADRVMAEAYGLVQTNDMAGAEALYTRVIDVHSGTSGAREARFYLANLYFVQSEWSKAIEQYEGYVDDHSDYAAGRTAAAWMAIGDSYQALGDHTQALSNYSRALAVESADYLSSDIIMGAARSACASGQLDLAEGFADDLFERIGNGPDMTRLRELLARHGRTYTRGF